MNRRGFLVSGIGTGLAGAVAGCSTPARSGQPAALPRRYQNGRSPWAISLDTSTIRPATMRQKIQAAAEAGYDAIEPWTQDLEQHVQSGGSLKDLRKELADHGLAVPSLLGLWDAIPVDPKDWPAKQDPIRRYLQMAADIGAEHIQTIPERGERIDIPWGAECYRNILELGLNEFGVNPALVFVKFRAIKRFDEAVAMALLADHPKAKVIPDSFHLYITGSGFSGLRQLHGDFIAIYQFNDAPAPPAGPERDQLEDKHRVMPGDGILPLAGSLRDLAAIGYQGAVSLELYNPAYWEMDPLTVAKIGLHKTLAVIAQALA